MVRIFVCLVVVLLMTATVTAQDAKNDQKQVAQDTETDQKQDAKQLSGMSIVGNDEAPKSLYIVPWKSSEIGVETSLDALLNEGDVPVDRDVFKRQLKFYQISTKK
jgi:hypothetical protein